MTKNKNQLENLRLLLNSKIINWFFSITSTNNHINNYELDTIPIIELDLINKFEKHDPKQIFEKHICSLYCLNKKETDYILNYHD